ncbi:ABC transporter substrate-binding protein [Planctomycetales bacterium ZRK34]|nr:ABC transporter substrate-binding protein [Planctomycetales bacterium ZRK34]
MSDWTPRLIVLACFVLILGLPFVFRPEAAEVPADALRLVVITPHNEQIRYETEQAFSRWHQAHHGRPVVIDWRAIGGTSDIERQLISEYAGLLEEGRMDDGVGYDIVFGGGDYFFESKLKAGVGGKHTILERLDFDDEFMSSVYPEPTIADVRLYDKDHMWYGVVLSSFGIAYNNDLLQLRDLPTPTTWSDLNDYRYFMGVALADPSHSGSIRVTYDAILQRYGWQRGWQTLRRVCANARYFSAYSSQVPVDVSQGDAIAGMCIDFYGRYQAEVIAASTGHDRIGYIAPADATVVTPDPVAVLRGAKHHDLAVKFVRWLLSENGQKLWCYRRGVEAGPERFELRRPPVRRDMYTPDRMANMVDAVNPYELAHPRPEGTPSYFTIVPTVLHAMAMDVHDQLKAAWSAIQNTDDLAFRAELLEDFDALPFTQEELLAAPARWKKDPAAKTEDRLAWTAFFREKYEKIITKASR